MHERQRFGFGVDAVQFQCHLLTKHTAEESPSASFHDVALRDTIPRRGQMGAIEEVRTLLQDVVAPDLKSLAVRVKNVEKQLAALEQRMDARLDKVDARFDKLERDSEKRRNELVTYLSLEARKNKIERALGTSGKQGQ